MFKNLRLRHKLALLVGAMTMNVVVFGLIAYNTIITVQVNGPIYDRIIQGKDLVADLLPPPQYLLETYLVAHQLATPHSARDLDTLLTRYSQLRTDYVTRHQYWTEHLTDPRIRELLLEKAHAPAERMFRLIDDQLIPVVKRSEHAEAANVLAGPLRSAYDEHRRAVDALVEAANQRSAAEEAGAVQVLRSRLRLLFGIEAVLLLATLLFAWRFVDTLTSNVAVITQAASHLALGRVDHALRVLSNE